MPLILFLNDRKVCRGYIRYLYAIFTAERKALINKFRTQMFQSYNFTGILEVGSIVATLYGVTQSRIIHAKEIEASRQHFARAMELAKKQHAEDMAGAKKTYLLELFYSLEQHFQQLNADLISSGRESERDMFDQRNQNFQTIILAASVMFSALSTVIVQGYLPLNASNIIFVSYALFCALSFASLFISIIVSLEVVRRASRFMYRRAHSHSKLLSTALHQTRNMMKDLMTESSEKIKLADNTAVNLKVRSDRIPISKMLEEDVEVSFRISFSSKMKI